MATMLNLARNSAHHAEASAQPTEVTDDSGYDSEPSDNLKSRETDRELGESNDQATGSGEYIGEDSQPEENDRPEENDQPEEDDKPEENDQSRESSNQSTGSDIQLLEKAYHEEDDQPEENVEPKDNEDDDNTTSSSGKGPTTNGQAIQTNSGFARVGSRYVVWLFGHSELRTANGETSSRIKHCAMLSAKVGANLFLHLDEVPRQQQSRYQVIDNTLDPDGCLLTMRDGAGLTILQLKVAEVNLFY
ncbi:MAG: hypothetical protein Q9209_004668 [Squamulea sp. 1 TL-2023]